MSAEQGELAWSAARSPRGHTNIASGGVLDLFGNNSAELNSTTLDNAGTINLTNGSNSFRLYYSTIQNNSGGVFDLQNDGSAFLNIYGSGSFVNNAGATLRKSSTGVSDFNAPLTNDGVVDVQNGALNLTGGGVSAGNFNVGNSATLLFNNAFTLNSGATLTGGGVFQLANTLMINGAISSPQNFEFDGGTLSIATGATFSITSGRTFTWNSGTITGSGSTNIESGGVLDLFGNNSAELNSTTLDNAGTINLTSGSNSFRLYYSTIQNNSGGVFDLQNDGSAFYNIYGSGSFVNNAGATLRKSSTGVSDFNAPLTNNGVVDVQNGTLNLTGGGVSAGNFNVGSSATLLFNNAFTLNSGATLTGGGVFQLANTLMINDAISSPQNFEFDRRNALDRNWRHVQHYQRPNIYLEQRHDHRIGQHQHCERRGAEPFRQPDRKP